MRRNLAPLALAVVFFSLSPGWSTEPDGEKPAKPLTVDELFADMGGKETTIRFKVAGLDGVSQRVVEGQAPTFVVETKPGKTANELDVWIEGELANVLDRLQLGFTQDNQLKPGATIVATGTLRATGGGHFTLTVSRWRDFKIESWPGEKEPVRPEDEPR